VSRYEFAKAMFRMMLDFTKSQWYCVDNIIGLYVPSYSISKD